MKREEARMKIVSANQTPPPRANDRRDREDHIQTSLHQLTPAPSLSPKPAPLGQVTNPHIAVRGANSCLLDTKQYIITNLGTDACHASAFLGLKAVSHLL